MGIMTRLVRLCKADIHGVMDQMEDKGLLLKQHLRDMREELDKKESRLASMLASREDAKREKENRAREVDTLESDLALAIAKEKDDIARTLIRKLKPLARHRDELERHIQALDADIARFRSAIDEQRLLYEQLQLKASEHLRRTERQQWNEALAETIPRCCPGAEPAEAEIELELLRRKEALKGGTDR
ncbi:MAG: PspA/IM30 family protein [Syntrophobacteraceae bacterium]